MKLKYLLAALLVSLGVSTWATFTGLTLIPTNDYTGANAWQFGAQTQSTYFHTDQFVLTEFGIGDRFELGIDYYANTGHADDRAYFNCKYMVFKSDTHKFYVSGGLYNLTANGTSIPFAVATKDFGIFRLHAGAQYEGTTDRATNFLCGADKIFSNGIQIMADYTHGQQNFTTAGVGYIGKHIICSGSVMWPNAGGSPVYLLRFIVTGKWPKR
jgi:hypothetical protein